ncbi:MAG: hypothetical protein AAFV53_17330 [Myxococcota bacterium]
MVHAAALPLLTLCLPLGTAALEISTGLALAAALPHLREAPRDLLLPLALITLGALFAAIDQSVIAMRHVAAIPWALAPLLAVPLLSRDAATVHNAERIGLISAAVVGAGAVIWAGWQDQWPARGPFSHHLTLGYALLVPLAIALERRRWGLAAAIAAGSLSTLSAGPLLSLVVLLAAMRIRPLYALIGGAIVAVGIVGLLTEQPMLQERATLWAAGARMTITAPLGAGAGMFRSPMADTQDLLSPGFHFPLHAHDTALQIGAILGIGGWIGWAWLIGALWRRAQRGGRAAIAAIAIGGLTQDTLGDLEVIRALCAWPLLNWPKNRTEPTTRRSNPNMTEEEV